MTRPIPECAYQFLEQAEGCRLTAYPDSGGVWTIGWGHTGPDVHEGLTITLDQARFLLRQVDATNAVRQLERVVDPERLSPDVLGDHHFAALVSFAFNLGVGPVAPHDEWTIWDDIEAGNLDQVPEQMMRFDKIRNRRTGVVTIVPGLLHRRAAEVALWNTADVASSVAIVKAAPIPAPPSSTTREADTPPTPRTPPPASNAALTAKGTAGVGVGGALLATSQLGETAGRVKAALEPYVDQVHALQGVLVICALVIAAALVADFLLHRHRQRAAAL